MIIRQQIIIAKINHFENDYDDNDCNDRITTKLTNLINSYMNEIPKW